MTNKEIAAKLHKLAAAHRKLEDKEKEFWESEAGKIVLAMPSTAWSLQSPAARYTQFAAALEDIQS